MLAWDNYDSNDYTYNEEYAYTVPEVPTEPPTYFLSSDSENDPCPDDCSSSGSSDYEDEEYFDKFSRMAEPNFLDVERVDDEADLIIPLETDDTDFGSIQTDRNGHMKCTICSIVFKSKLRYGIHQRRHFAVDHFKCPVCSKGFNKLSQCQTHELVEHNNNNTASGNGSSPNSSEKREYTFRTRNARKTHHFNESLDFNEADLTIIVPSTSLYPYRGPEVLGVYKSYEIEVKYGRPERKSHSRLQSKYILESQKRLKKNLELKEAQLELAEKKKVERALRRAKRRAETNGTEGSEQEPALKVPIPIEKRNNIARAHPARQRQSLFSPLESNSGPKCYFCSLCGFTSEDESGIHTHQELVHPDESVSDLINFFFIDKSLREKKEKPQPKPDEVTPPKRVGRPRKVRANKSLNNSYLSPSKVIKNERRKEAKLFRPRKHVPRVWEKPLGMPHTEEFIFAIDLIRKTDVMLGPRKRQSLTSSSLLRRGRRDVSPVSPTKKSIRIELERLSTKNKRFFLCDHCEFYAQCKTEVRRHRRNEHLKNLRAVPPEVNSIKPKPRPAPVVEVPKKKKKHKKKKNGVYHTSGSSASSATRTASHSQGSSKSYRNSSPDPGPSNSFLNSAPGPSMNRFLCTQCDFRGVSQMELERHEQRRHNKSLEVLTCDIPREVIDRMLGIYNGTLTPASSSISSAASSRSSSPPPRKKTKV